VDLVRRPSVIFRKSFSHILTRGFTLIEVLIALAVFAAVGISLAKNSSTVVLQTSRMQDRVVALSVASNIANDFLARGTDQPPFEQASRKTREILQANRMWSVETKLSVTSDENLKQLTVLVSPADAPNDVLAEITTFIGRN